MQVDMAASKLENVNKQLRKQMEIRWEGEDESERGRGKQRARDMCRHLRLSELRSGYAELEDRLTHVENERRKQETWLRERYPACILFLICSQW